MVYLRSYIEVRVRVRVLLYARSYIERVTFMRAQHTRTL